MDYGFNWRSIFIGGNSAMSIDSISFSVATPTCNDLAPMQSAYCGHCIGLKPEAMMAVFRIWRPAKSQNKIKPGSKSHWFAYAAERKKWIELLSRRMADGLMPRATASTKRAIRMTREYDKSKGSRARPYDISNLVGGMKVIVDAMTNEIVGRTERIKGAGIIWDDDAAHLVPIYDQRPSLAGDAVLFEVWDLLSR